MSTLGIVEGMNTTKENIIECTDLGRRMVVTYVHVGYRGAPEHHKTKYYRMHGLGATLGETVCTSAFLDRLVGLVVKASALGAEDPELESRLCRGFSGPSLTSDLKIGTPVATLPGAWHYRVSAGTGRPGVSIL